jgi:hypothetical protein
MIHGQLHDGQMTEDQLQKLEDKILARNRFAAGGMFSSLPVQNMRYISVQR